MGQPKDLAQIATFIQTLITQRGKVAKFDATTPLFTSGLLDSISGIELIVFLEKNYDLDFFKIGIGPEDINSLEQIHSLIAK